MEDLIEYPSLILIVGKSKSGKSYLVRYLMYHACVESSPPKFQFGIVFSSTKFNKNYDFICGGKYVFDRFDMNLLDNYLTNLSKLKPIPPNFIILDDMLGIINWYDPRMLRLIACFRHTNTTLFICIQRANKVGTLVRENCDRCFMFHPNNAATIDVLHKDFGQKIKKADDWRDFIYEQTAEPYSCLVYKDNEKDPKKQFVRFKAPEQIPKFEIVY